MTIEVVEGAQVPVEAVTALCEAAAEADGVAPLGEQPLLALAARDEGMTHLVASGPGGETVGYAQLSGTGREATAEVAVAPKARRRGVGTALVRRVLGLDPAVAVWAHGDLPAARAVAGALGLDRTRELLMMRRVAAEGPRLPDATPSAGVRLTTLAEIPAADRDRVLDELLRVNNAAFSWHPEQGGWTRADLDARLGASWVRPEGVFLATESPGDGAAGVEHLLGFHWTKVHPATADAPAAGEVYVVGVDPDQQGRGLGALLTSVGVAYLEAHGLDTVVLYVEGDNTAALRTYERLGFGVAHTDVTYSRVH